MERLTPTQWKALRFIEEFIEDRDYAPTLDEIAEGLGVAKPTVQQYLQALEGKDAIRRRRYAHRSIEVLPREEEGKLPLVGRIAAGEPIEAIEDVENVNIADVLGVDPERPSFILRVKGDSMIEEGIFDSDYVIVEKRDSADNGETVVALLPDDTATLKKFYREKGRIRLQPANENMEPIYVREVTIQGVVTGVFRAMK